VSVNGAGGGAADRGAADRSAADRGAADRVHLASGPRDIRGLNILRPEGANPSAQMARMREQLRAADVVMTVERTPDEPEDVRYLRRQGETFLAQARYEAAEEAFLDAIDAGLAVDHFCWSAALNLVNCHRLLERPLDAESTAAQLAEMFVEQPGHPIHYLLATQRGAIAADRWDESGDSADAAEALHWARTAYDWQVSHRQHADALRAYNLLVALLRVGGRDEALAVYARHEHDDEFQTVWRQSEKAADIGTLVG
jgi:tetratricopeptide (TPR) repeat protein